MKRIHSACVADGSTSADVSLRWIMYHSELRQGDGMVLGERRIDLLLGNPEACRKKPLSNEILDAAHELWADVKDEIKGLYRAAQCFGR